MRARAMPLLAKMEPIPKTSAQDTIEIVFVMVAILLTAYVLYLEFLAWPLVIAVAATAVLFAGFQGRLARVQEDETLYWTVLATLCLFMTLSSVTASQPNNHLILATMFILCALDFWIRSKWIILITMFLLAFTALRLLYVHLP